MSALAVAMMVLVCGLLWGGFAALLVRAIRREGAKSATAEGRRTG